ncbi:MAG: multidrug transporter [Dehalococcoidia bacterium]|nr:multidrug transporter [Dehalococcoidia bacterium]
MSLQDSDRIQLILNGSIKKMLFKLAGPNMVSVLFMLLVGFAEPFFAGQLGIIQLASVAITYPLVSLSGMIGGGAVGGGVVSALSRSIGKNDLDRANVVIWHSFIIYCVVSIIFFIVFVFFSRNLFIAMGVEESVVEKAVGYSRLFFILSPSIFLFYLMMSIYRSFGDYQFLAVINVLLGVLQLFLSGALSLGWFFFPSLGVNGLALAFVIPQGMAGILMFISILFGKYPIRFKILALRKEIFVDILNVGGLGAINSTSIALTMVFTTAFISRFGTEAIAGYGVCARLEQTLIPLSFGVGGVLTSCVGTNFGANQFYRARKSAWLGATFIASIAAIAGVTFSIFPNLWLDFFTTDLEAYIIGALYLSIVAPFFPLFAFGKTLYFASQGTGKMLIPISGAITRLIIVMIFGFICVFFELEIKYLFFIIGIAMSSVGLILTLNMFGSVWNPKKST